MKILFSPIGTADPITQLGDGPMLHIVRHYKPDKVVLFLSPKMREFQDLDERYTDAIERLCAAEGWPVPTIEQVDSAFEEVYRFDHYISEFEGILKRLCDESPDDPVLVNVTSGTPGWQQALVAIGSFGRLRLKLLQVTTPRKDINKRQDREKPGDYDPDTMWEWNEELRADDPAACESRIIEVETPNFADRLLRENVIGLVRSYDYEAAYTLASASRCISVAVKQMICAARDRLNLENVLPTKVFAKSPLAYRPNDLLGEYLSVMQVRLAQGYWADFARLLTPALTQLCKEVLRRSGLPERSYLRVERGKLTSKLDWNIIDRDARLSQALYEGLSGRPTYISNGILAVLIEDYCSDRDVADRLKALRDFEVGCRNKLAHELSASSKQTLERYGGLKLETVLKYLFDLHGNVRPHLYADINDAIINQL